MAAAAPSCAAEVATTLAAKHSAAALAPGQRSTASHTEAASATAAKATSQSLAAARCAGVAVGECSVSTAWTKIPASIGDEALAALVSVGEQKRRLGN